MGNAEQITFYKDADAIDPCFIEKKNALAYCLSKKNHRIIIIENENNDDLIFGNSINGNFNWIMGALGGILGTKALSSSTPKEVEVVEVEEEERINEGGGM